MLQKIKLTLLLIASIPLLLSLEACYKNKKNQNNTEEKTKPKSEEAIKKQILGKWQEENSDYILEFTADGKAFEYKYSDQKPRSNWGYSIQKDQLIYEFDKNNNSSRGTRIIEKLNKKELIIKYVDKEDRETITKFKRVQ